MRAAVMRGGRLVVDEVPDPVPGPGQVLVETLACGICGSDIHFLQHHERLVEAARESGVSFDFDPGRDLVMGHEFSARVLETGPGASGVQPGDVVVSLPAVAGPGGPFPVGYSNDYPGGYGERMVLTAALCLKVPEGLDPRHAALTEPMAVGVHAVRRACITREEGAIVLGCGPVGLAVVAALRLIGVEPIVAADPSPTRRGLATHLGAQAVVAPSEERAIDAYTRAAGERRVVIFEAVGVPGMLDEAMRAAPRGSQILVVGACMEPDTILPMLGVNKELTIRFAFGHEPLEFRDSLDAVARGDIDVAPLITDEVGIAGVPGAFETLKNPEGHAKILVEPAAG